MTRKLILAAGFTGLLIAVAGCGKDGKPADPKLDSGVKEDPRLKPATAGTGGTSKRPTITTP